MTEKLSECCKNCNGEGRIELNSSSMMAYWADHVFKTDCIKGRVTPYPPTLKGKKRENVFARCVCAGSRKLVFTDWRELNV